MKQCGLALVALVTLCGAERAASACSQACIPQRAAFDGKTLPSLIAGLPLLWMIMPRHSPLSFFAALGIALLQGLLGMGWGIGATRQLFVGLVPPEHKTEFMAVHYAWMGAIGGLSQLLGGRLLDFTSGLSGKFLIFTIDPYTVLFLAAVIIPVAASAALAGAGFGSTNIKAWISSSARCARRASSSLP